MLTPKLKIGTTLFRISIASVCFLLMKHSIGTPNPLAILEGFLYEAFNCGQKKEPVMGSKTKSKSERAGPALLNADLCTCFFKLLLGVFSICFRNPFLHRFRSRFHQILRFLQAQSGQNANDLQNSNLLVSRNLV